MSDYDVKHRTVGSPHPHQILAQVQKAMVENDKATVGEVMDQVHGMGYYLQVTGLRSSHWTPPEPTPVPPPVPTPVPTPSTPDKPAPPFGPGPVEPSPPGSPAVQ